jgi:hypothetical protein
MKRDCWYAIHLCMLMVSGLLVSGCGDDGRRTVVDAWSQSDTGLIATDVSSAATTDAFRPDAKDASPIGANDSSANATDANDAQSPDLLLPAEEVGRDLATPAVDSFPDPAIAGDAAIDRGRLDAHTVDVGRDGPGIASDGGTDAAAGIDVRDAKFYDGGSLDQSASTMQGPFKQISTFDGYVCGVRVDGALLCWGYPYISAEWPVSPLSGSFEQVSVGNAGACALRSDGRLACWGLPGSTGLLGNVPSGTFSQVSVGTVACAIRGDGTLACWGDNPILINAPVGTFSQLSVGSHVACALRANGSVACWADSYFLKPSAVEVMNDMPPGSFAAISVGLTPCAIGTDSTAVCLVFFSNPPVLMPFDKYLNSTESTLGTARQVASATDLCVLRTDGTLSCSLDQSPPSGTFVQVACGSGYACAIATDQSVRCWGDL